MVNQTHAMSQAISAQQNYANAYNGNSSMRGPLQQAAQNFYTTNNTNGSSQIFGTVGQAYTPPYQAPFDPNKIESLSIDLDTLVGLWVAKYGSKWVPDKKFMAVDTSLPAHETTDEFWYHAFQRLLAHNKFEHYANWSRLKESA